MSLGKHSFKVISAGIAGAIAISGLVALPASAHTGGSYNNATQALCEENRRLMQRSGHLTGPYQQTTPGAWYFFYYH